MRLEAAAALWDAERAARLVTEFVSGRSFEYYESDPMLRSAVERQFEVLGEALNRVKRYDEELASQVPDLAKVVAFRNVIAHGYDVLDNHRVWDYATNFVGALGVQLQDLLREAAD